MKRKILLILLLITPSYFNISNATTIDLDGFGAQTSNTGNTVMNSGNIIIGIVQAIGIIAAIIMLIMVAIKYVSAAPEAKAEIKKSVIIYVVGAILLFATSGILELIQTFSGEILGGEDGEPWRNPHEMSESAICWACNGDNPNCSTCGGDGIYGN